MINELTERFVPGSPLRLSLKATENRAKSRLSQEGNRAHPGAGNADLQAGPAAIAAQLIRKLVRSADHNIENRFLTLGGMAPLPKKAPYPNHR